MLPDGACKVCGQVIRSIVKRNPPCTQRKAPLVEHSGGCNRHQKCQVIARRMWLWSWSIEAPANSARWCPWAQRFSPAYMQVLCPKSNLSRGLSLHSPPAVILRMSLLLHSELAHFCRRPSLYTTSCRAYSDPSSDDEATRSGVAMEAFRLTRRI